MLVLARLEGLNRDSIRVAVIGEYNILVATTGSEGEASRAISVEFSDILSENMFFGHHWEGSSQYKG